jgi:DNA-binding FadR family transcriptional regulator
VNGAGGGSFVTLPTPDHVSAFLKRNFGLLSLTDEVTLAEFLEAREVLEVFAARKVAVRQHAEDIEALRATLMPPESGASAEEQYLHNREFHAVLVDACGNSFLRISAQPIFSVLHAHLSRAALATGATLPPEFPRKVCAEHKTILEAIEAGDPDLAESRMREHLTELGEVYAGLSRSRQGTSSGDLVEIV